MKRLTLGIVLSVALVGCKDQEHPPAKTATEELAPVDVAAGKAFAERECKGCHGLDGKGAAPGIPHLAAQRERYLLTALKAYKEGKRMHAALREIAKHMSEADALNLAAYYAGLPAVQAGAAQATKPVNPYEQGKALAAACAKCHGEDGNASVPGTPSLAGQQPQYLVIAIQEYLSKERKAAPMHALLPGLSRLDMERLALYSPPRLPHRAAPRVGATRRPANP